MRSSNDVVGETWGIQHVVHINHVIKLTFLNTPGHEALQRCVRGVIIYYCGCGR